MSKYTEAVEKGLAGLKFVSSSICPSCETCMSEFEYTDPELFEADWSSGKVFDEGHFSWRSCECCGSPLGGTRYVAHGVDSNGDINHFEICFDCAMYLDNGVEPENMEN